MVWQAIGDEVELHSALPEGEGPSLARAVMEELSAALLDADRRDVASLVPEWLRPVVSGARYAGELDADGVYDRVAARLGLERRRAVELTKLVCSSVTHRLTGEETRVLRTHLPDHVAALLEDRPHELTTPINARPPSTPPPGEGHTLSSGKPGSHAPLSSERPGSDHPVSEED